jgi:hypothetical protein
MSFAKFKTKTPKAVKSGLLLAAVALCFLALFGLAGWMKKYAASEAWATRVNEEGLEWSPIVNAAAQTMAGQPSYRNQEAFFQALSSVIKGKPVRGKGKAEIAATDAKFLKTLSDESKEQLRKYRQLLEEQTTWKDKLRSTWERWAESPPTSAIEIKGGSSKAAEFSLAAINAESVDRSMLGTSLQWVVADREARIKSDDAGIQAAFDAALPSARPVSWLPSGFQPLAIRIGDEKDSLHIFYLVTEYGLEGLAVVLLCILIVPWVIRLIHSDNPETIRKKLIDFFKGLLNRIPGVGDAAAGVGKAMIALVVGSAALASVAIVSGDQPPVAQIFSPPKTVTVAGAPGKAGTEGKPGINGGNGKDGVNADTEELTRKIEDQEERLRQQALLLASLQGSLTKVSRQADQNKVQVQEVVREAEIVVTNLNLLSNGIGTLTSDVSTLNYGVCEVSDTTRSLLRASGAANLHLAESLDRLGKTTAMMAKDVCVVKTNVGEVGTEVKGAASELLRVSGLSRGFLPAINPFYQYQVTPAVVETVSRALEGNQQKKQIVSALRVIPSDSMKLRTLKRELQKACHGCDPAVLGQLMPLIEKVSRVRNRRGAG